MACVTTLPPQTNDQKYSSVRLSPPTSSRILYHLPCKVCRDHSSGKHYGIYACDGCAGFFKRSIRRARQYVCKSQKRGFCIVDKTHRNQCRACRLRKCFDVGMNRDAVQHERGPRNSTMRRHLAMYKDVIMSNNDIQQIPTELLTATLNGFPMIPGLPLPMPNTMQQAHPALSSVTYQSSPRILDLSVPRATHQTLPATGFFGPGTAYINATRSLPPSPPLIATDHIKEQAAEHLFRNIYWLKGKNSFAALSKKDQLVLLKDTWKDFFILAITQYLMPLNFTQLLVAYESDNPNSNHKIVNLVNREVPIFLDVLHQICNLSINPMEYECLRLVVLFRKPDNDSKEHVANSSFSSVPEDSWKRGLLEPLKVIAHYEESKHALYSHVLHANPSQALVRYHSLLGVMPLMQKVSSFTIEELFFRKTIGSITIVNLILDMYRRDQI